MTRTAAFDPTRPGPQAFGQNKSALQKYLNWIYFKFFFLYILSCFEILWIRRQFVWMNFLDSNVNHKFNYSSVFKHGAEIVRKNLNLKHLIIEIYYKNMETQIQNMNLDLNNNKTYLI
ncbi:hypothetical protein NQD34_018109 [Periophthalmus magnuspinnatus]|nr:hypothetical protein NQD34_018109 [Periophthalmus magnuspinnatus]